MKASFSSKLSSSLHRTLAAKLRLKQHKVERIRGMLRHLEAECERLEGEIRRHCS